MCEGTCARAISTELECKAIIAVLEAVKWSLIRTASCYLHFFRDGCQIRPFEMRGDVYCYSKQRYSNEGRRECFRLSQKTRHEVRKMSRGLKG
jgi:hypothetical protein